MLNVISMATTRKIAIEYIQKEMRRESKCFTKKKKKKITYTEMKMLMQEMRNKKAIRHIENK